MHTANSLQFSHFICSILLIVLPVGFEPTLPRFSYLLQLSLLIVYINIAQSFVVWTLPLPCWYYTNLGIPCQVSTPFIWSNL
jgi:hypothetical protein